MTILDNNFKLVYHTGMFKHIEGGIAGRIMGNDSLSWIRDTATALGVSGAVFTKPDGSIKLVADGEEGTLVEFVKEIERGRVFSSVENFYINWSDTKNLGNFFIINK
jgi:acylphosphatase